MLASIHPLGERSRNQRFGITVTAHVLGATIGGVALGGALGLVGAGLAGVIDPSDAVVATLVALVCAVTALWELARLPFPSIRRQVDEDWLHRYRGWVYGGAFGVQLGLGVVTIVTTATVYATFALALLTGSAAAGAVVGGAFGLVRGLTVLRVAHVRDPATLRDVHRRVQLWAGPVRRVGMALLLGAALVAAVGA
jgi:hypothetical protein